MWKTNIKIKTVLTLRLMLASTGKLSMGCALARKDPLGITKTLPIIYGYGARGNPVLMADSPCIVEKIKKEPCILYKTYERTISIWMKINTASPSWVDRNSRTANGTIC